MQGEEFKEESTVMLIVIVGDGMAGAKRFQLAVMFPSLTMAFLLRDILD